MKDNLSDGHGTYIKLSRKEKMILRDFRTLEKTNGRRWWYRVDYEDEKILQTKLNVEK